MAGISELDRLTTEESADLASRVERFRASWQGDGTTAIEWFLPPRGARHRRAVLVQLILIDMENREQTKLPFEVESYLAAYSDDITAATVPVEVLVTEYNLRHRQGDRPSVEEYRNRFPLRHSEFVQQIAQGTAPSGRPPSNAPSNNTQHTNVTPVIEKPNSVRKPTVLSDRRSDTPSPPPSPPAQEVGELHRTGPVNFLETPRPGEGSTILPTDTPYQLLRKLGSGAFGEVYEALAPGGIRVAVKRILRTVDHPASKAERGALDAIKELSHPFLLKTNAYWVFDDRLVIVMELADGSLGDRIEHHVSQGRTGIPPEELISLFEQAGEALDYLHSQNVSHRDIKPENILVMKGYAKVADFGLARLHEHTMTVVNNTVGTPAYMAPEMWKQKVSLQSDQYSLAATYVRARLNRNLFTTNVLVDLANFHINETPNLDPLPAAEQKVLLKALSKDPHDRYRNCVEFAKALRVAITPVPEPPKPVEQPKEGRTSALWPMLLVGLACVLIVGAVAYFTRQKDPPPGPGPGPGPVVNPGPVAVQPERRYATYPDFWQPVGKGDPRLEEEKDDAREIRGTYYHLALTRKVGDTELTAYLIYPTTSQGHPDPFYMLEHKVTNKVFNTVWKLIESGQRVKEVSAKGWAPGAWRKGGKKQALDINGVDADLPVLAVTVPEAMLVAEELSGTIPDQQQWLKATGVLEGNAMNGPAGPPLDIPENLDPKGIPKWKREQFRMRKLALGLPPVNDSLARPLPIHDDAASGDRSRWRIRQLVSNGQEWLRSNHTMERFRLFPLPGGSRSAFAVGAQPSDLELKSLGELRNSPRAYDWYKVDEEDAVSGFRIVLEPK